jgi:SAM-dependent methyltransferase
MQSNRNSKHREMTEAASMRRQIFEERSLKASLRRMFRFNTTCRDGWVREQARKLPKGSKILDVGAGCAPYRDLFNHCEYLTQDFGLEPATQDLYTPLDYECDITDIPVDDSSFDAVLCTEVLEHLPEPIKAIQEISRILRPNGMVFLTAPLGSHLHQQPYHFYGGYTSFWYQEFLPRYNFDVHLIERNRGFFSLFAQEGLRFSFYISPKELLRKPFWLIALFPLWFVTLPLFKLLLPMLAKSLDALELEDIATAGYHVVAKKRQL